MLVCGFVSNKATCTKNTNCFNETTQDIDYSLYVNGYGNKHNLPGFKCQ